MEFDRVCERYSAAWPAWPGHICETLIKNNKPFLNFMFYVPQSRTIVVITAIPETQTCVITRAANSSRVFRRKSQKNTQACDIRDVFAYDDTKLVFPWYEDGKWKVFAIETPAARSVGTQIAKITIPRPIRPSIRI